MGRLGLRVVLILGQSSDEHTVVTWERLDISLSDPTPNLHLHFNKIPGDREHMKVWEIRL